MADNKLRIDLLHTAELLLHTRLVQHGMAGWLWPSSASLALLSLPVPPKRTHPAASRVGRPAVPTGQRRSPGECCTFCGTSPISVAARTLNPWFGSGSTWWINECMLSTLTGDPRLLLYTVELQPFPIVGRDFIPLVGCFRNVQPRERGSPIQF